MKTLKQIKEEYKSKTIDGRDLSRLAQFIPESELKDFGIELMEEFVGKHQPIPFNKENVLKQLKEDVDFGFQKALDCRGISSSMMAEVVKMWNWILEEGLEDFDEYPMYGLPIFKATAQKYGFNNPIGEDTGSEEKYNE
jgi:translation elongation factor EF-G